MFKNEVKLLKRENEQKARWLDDEDEDVIDKIMDSLGIFRVNSFDIQVIYKDLIGMAEEAELRDSNMKEIIGDDIKNATYEIINNSRGYSKAEVLLVYLKYLSGIAFLMVGFFGTMVNMGLIWEISIAGLIGYFQYVTYFFLVSKLVRPLLHMEGWGRLGFYWTLFIALGLFGVPYATLAHKLYGNAISSVNSLYVLIGSAIIYIAATYLHYRDVKKYAEGR